MPMLDRPAFSYRDDPAVPAFEDAPLFVFDGVCVLCSGSAGFIMRHDEEGKARMTSAQGALGEALYRHYGLALDDSYLFIREGRAFTKSAGYLELLAVLGGWWRLLRALGVLPERWRDWAYDRLAANRYRWFGKTEYCALLTPEQRSRLIDPAAPGGGSS
ncbi:MAG: thiol-disulfide oxidoreductase DCC family protein [Sphingomonas sp.]